MPEWEHARVAVVEDDSSMRTALSRLLRFARFEVQTFGSAGELLATPVEFKCVVVDVHLGGMTGVELHAALERAGREVPVILITGYDTPVAEEYAREAGLPYFRKPILARDLLPAVESAIAGGKGATALNERQRA
jgi:FixJ family two-component response regulator